MISLSGYRGQISWRFAAMHINLYRRVKNNQLHYSKKSHSNPIRNHHFGIFWLVNGTIGIPFHRAAGAGAAAGGATGTAGTAGATTGVSAGGASVHESL